MKCSRVNLGIMRRPSDAPASPWVRCLALAVGLHVLPCRIGGGNIGAVRVPAKARQLEVALLALPQLEAASPPASGGEGTPASPRQAVGTPGAAGPRHGGVAMARSLHLGTPSRAAPVGSAKAAPGAPARARSDAPSMAVQASEHVSVEAVARAGELAARASGLRKPGVDEPPESVSASQSAPHLEAAGATAVAAIAPATGGDGRGSGERAGALAGVGGARRTEAGSQRADLRVSKPRLLLGGSDPCHGLFPWRAQSDHGEVTLVLRVDPSGYPQLERVVDEQPRGEGFAEAARSCARRLRFSAAHDARGVAIAARSVVKLGFDRH